MEHPQGQKYTISASTKEVKTTGHIVLTVVTLGHDVADMNDVMRVDLCDHPLYKQLQQYVKNNPR